MWEPASFDREEYLLDYELFEGEKEYVPENELCEFNGDPFALALELAHTRFKLAETEKLNGFYKGFYEKTHRIFLEYLFGRDCHGRKTKRRR